MVVLCLLLILLAGAIALPLTLLAERLGHRLAALDGQGVAGQVKAPPRRVPNIGGIGLFWAVAAPMLMAILGVWFLSPALADRFPSLLPHLPGIKRETPLAATLLACLAGLHVLGLFDDRRPLGPWFKIVVMAGCAALVASTSDTRLLTLLDAHVGGPWLSIAITILWIVVVTNAMNFIDNMDGLSAGVAAIAGLAFLAAALLNGQWFVGACLALLVGALTGFLVRNFPPAKIFMGDGGSLVVGFLLAFLSVRLTYAAIGSGPSGPEHHWYAVLTPLVVLAVPLYDFTSVVLIRLRQGRSPFVGDLQHLSHRLVRRGMSRRSAVLVIWALTAATAIGGVILGSLQPWQALIVGAQTFLILASLAILEFATAPYAADDPRAVGPESRGRG